MGDDQHVAFGREADLRGHAGWSHDVECLQRVDDRRALAAVRKAQAEDAAGQLVEHAQQVTAAGEADGETVFGRDADRELQPGLVTRTN